MASSAKQSGGSRWWSGLFAPRRPPAPFEVTCRCGRLLRGWRRRRSQVVRCPNCALRVFVFPRSPWHANSSASPDFPPFDGPSPARQAWLRMRTPLLAGGVTLALFVTAFLILLPFLGRPTPAPTQPKSAPGEFKQHVEAGRRALTDGSFNVAARELNAAVELRDQRPDLLTANESRDLNQLQRQADLLARVHSLPLSDVFKEALLTRNDDDWRARFEMEHKGKAVIFDDVVRRDPATGRLVLACFEVRAGAEKAVVALDDLKILLPLRLEPGHRLIFGGRLRSVERAAGGAWVVRFDADSGVLLTDAAALTACSPVPPDADVLRTLRRQEEWLRDLPAQRPAP